VHRYIRLHHHITIDRTRVERHTTISLNVSPQDGYPRTVGQAEALDKSQKIARVLNITLKESVLLELLARRVCGDCGRGYNVADINQGEIVMPPLLPKPSDCDRCHGKPRLITREDDTAAVVKTRLEVYKKQTLPLIQYYRTQKKLQDFDVKKGLDDTPRLMAELEIK
jgi:adenylate kinase